MARQDAYEVKVGDIVKYTSGDRRWRDGTVVKVGPKLVHVNTGGRIDKYERDGQQRQDGYPGSFQTLEQLQYAQDWTAAINKLREHGILIQVLGRWPLSKLEKLVAAVLAIQAPLEVEEEE